MSEVYFSIDQMIGHTPLLKLKASLLKIPTSDWLKSKGFNEAHFSLSSTVFAKVEYFNPGGSVKDRIALSIIDGAEKAGKLKAGGTIVEATSGNTGAGLAMLAAARGYKAIFCMPDKMSAEKINALRAYGAKVVITPNDVGPEHPEYYCNVASRMAKEIPGAFLADQFYNQDNVLAHYQTTGPELWEQTQGKIDVFAAGIGTGGTLSGTAKFLKEKNPQVKILAVDPVGSIYAEYIRTGVKVSPDKYLVEGVGQNKIPGTMNVKIVDEVISVNDHMSFGATRMLAQKEGLLVGGSCGTAWYALVQYMKFLEISEKRSNLVGVVLLPDSGSRYLSKVFNPKWIRENKVNETWCDESLGGDFEYVGAAKKVEGVV